MITINGYIKTYNWAQQNEVERRIRNLGLPVRFTDNGVSNSRTYEITDIDNHIHMGEWIHLKAIFKIMFGGSLETYVDDYDLAE